MNPSNREQGMVSRIDERSGRGLLSTVARSSPLAFFLRDAKGPNGEKLAVTQGDCFEFSVSEANAGSKKDRAQQQQRHNPDENQSFAVRLTPLARGSVEVGESIDRSRRLRGFISQMPEKVSSAAAA